MLRTHHMAAQPTNPAESRMAPDAIRDAYQVYRAELQRFLARRSRTAHDGEDLAQEVYLQLLRFPPRGPLRETQAYLYRIAWHVVNRANEKAQREGIPCDIETLDRLAQEAGHIAGDDPGRRLATQQQLVRLLGELPHICRQVILRFKCDGLSYKEIAADLGISVHMVEKHIARAVQHIKTADWDY